MFFKANDECVRHVSWTSVLNDINSKVRKVRLRAQDVNGDDSGEIDVEPFGPIWFS